jgi:hypothetical protein
MRKGLLILAAIVLALSIGATGGKILLPESETGPMTVELVQGYRFDPLQDTPELPAELTAQAPQGEYGYYLVQFAGKVRPEWKRSVEKLGGEFLWYLPRYAFVARLPVNRVEEIRALPEVRWVGLDQPAYKVIPGLENSFGPQTLIVVFHYAEDGDALVDQLRALGARNIVTEFNPWNKSVKLDVDGSAVKAIARLPGVYWIEPYAPITPDNVDVQWVDQKGYSGVADTSRPVWRRNVTGRHVLVGITDLPCNHAHDLFRDPVNNTPGPNHRKVYRYYGTLGSADHGTHTTGTLCGNDAPVGGASLNDGLAKDSRVCFQNYNSLPTNWDMNVWFARPDTGLNINVDSLRSLNHSMSLSRKDSFNDYVFTDMTTDQFVWSHRKFMHCNSMGNRTVNEMGHPVNAKDIISVGSVSNGTGCRTFSTFSSRGPTLDGRRKPQLCSPGDVVYSADYSVANGYIGMSGTSMATPNMTAATALIREYFRMGYYPTGDTLTGTPREISAALNKAVAIVGADNSITGYTVPDNNIGWGRIDLDSSLYFARDSSKLWVVEDSLTTGQYREYSINISGQDRPFRVALIWSDYPGTMRAAHILVNDLNLLVTSPTGTPYKGSVYSAGQSATGGLYDTINVEECFRRNVPEIGVWTVRVTADHVPQGSQPFALAAIGKIAASDVKDVGVTRIMAPSGSIDSTQNITPACSVYNFGSTTETYNVRMKVGLGYNLTASVTGHAPSTRLYVTFPAYAAWPRGNGQVVSCSTELATDIARNNDKATGTVNVRVLDAEALAITAPIGTVDSGASIPPQANVRNNGNTAVDFPVTFTITGGYSNTQLVTGLAPGATQLVNFVAWAALPRGSLVTSAATGLVNDMVPGNNTATGSVEVQVKDVGCQMLLAPSGSYDSAATEVPACSVYNYGTVAASYDVRMKIGAQYENAVSVAGHQPLTAQYLTFPVWTANERGSLVVSCSTEYAEDQVAADDKQTGTVFMQMFDAGATGILAPLGPYDSGAVVTPRAVIHNYGNTEQTFDIDFVIDDGYANTITRAVGPGADSTFSFADWTASARGAHLATCTTKLANDQNLTNDKTTGDLSVSVHDVGVEEIVAPVGSIMPGTPVVPQATLHNYGTQREALLITFTINSTPPYTSSRTLGIGLPLGVDTIVSFSPWTAVTGTLAGRCSLHMPGDQKSENDTLSQGFTVGSMDVAVTGINAPVGGMTPGYVKPEAKIKNLGDFTLSFPVSFDIFKAGAAIYSDTQPVSDLAPNVEVVVRFDSVSVDTGSYTTKAMSQIADQNPANDSQVGSFTVSRTLVTGGWTQKADVPTGGKNKKVKDGGSLAYTEGGTGGQGSGAGDDPTGYIYALKGNNRCEFYQYNVEANSWATKESIPPIGRAGKKKMVKKGASLAQADGRLYATKGNNTLEFWQYDPSATDAYPWSQKADVPMGVKNVKEGTGAVAVQIGDTNYIYFLKGSGTQEFYRYNTLTNAWETKATAPAGLSGKMFKNGSCLAYDGENTVYALKGSYNEFFAYQVDSNVWTTKAGLPLIGSSGRKKKVKDGAGIAYLSGNWGLSQGFRPTKSGTVPEFQRSAGCLYALKGGNTQEFWKYVADSDRWTQKEDMPLGGGKRVKGGGALVTGGGVLFALKGNNTLEFWQYTPGAMSNDEVRMTNTMTGSGVRTSTLALHTSPNPFSGMTTIRYSLPNAGNISLKLYDVTGKFVSTLASGYHNAGASSFVVHRSSFARGVYVLKLETGNSTATTKLIIE